MVRCGDVTVARVVVRAVVVPWWCLSWWPWCVVCVALVVQGRGSVCLSHLWCLWCLARMVPWLCLLCACGGSRCGARGGRGVVACGARGGGVERA